MHGFESDAKTRLKNESDFSLSPIADDEYEVLDGEDGEEGENEVLDWNEVFDWTPALPIPHVGDEQARLPTPSYFHLPDFDPATTSIDDSDSRTLSMEPCASAANTQTDISVGPAYEILQVTVPFGAPPVVSDAALAHEGRFPELEAPPAVRSSASRIVDFALAQVNDWKQTQAVASQPLLGDVVPSEPSPPVTPEPKERTNHKKIIRNGIVDESPALLPPPSPGMVSPEKLDQPAKRDLVQYSSLELEPLPIEWRAKMLTFPESDTESDHVHLALAGPRGEANCGGLAGCELTPSVSLATVFHLLDSDGDGVISGQDVQTYFCEGDAEAKRSLFGIADSFDARALGVIAKGIDDFEGPMDLATFMRLHST